MKASEILLLPQQLLREIRIDILLQAAEDFRQQGNHEVCLELRRLADKE